MRDVSDVLIQLTHCMDWEVGSWYNCLIDGYPEYIPATEDAAVESIYNCLVTNKYWFGSCQYGAADPELRFLGKDRLVRLIRAAFNEDEDIAAIRAEKGW